MRRTDNLLGWMAPRPTGKQRGAGAVLRPPHVENRNSYRRNSLNFLS